MGAIVDALTKPWPKSSQTFGERLESLGSTESEQIEDRRDEGNPFWNQEVGLDFAHIFGIPTIHDIQLFQPPRHRPPAGQLSREAGYYDIDRHEADESVR